MSYTRAWNESIPDGSEDKTFGDDRIREFKADIRERLATEHTDIATSAGLVELRHLAGLCAVMFNGTTTEINALSSPPRGAVAFDTTLRSWKYYDGATWVRGDPIPSGTRMLLCQASAPTGWTQYTGLNDKMVRVVSSTGGGTGGSWTVSGLSSNTVVDHTHSVGSHTHGVSGLYIPYGGSGIGLTTSNSMLDNATGGSGNIPISGTTDASTGTTGAAGTHNHTISQDGTWRPAYVDVIVCIKD